MTKHTHKPLAGKLLAGAAAAALIAGLAGAQEGPTIDDARAFIAEAEAALAENYELAARTFWAQETNITFDTNWLASRVSAESTRLAVDLAERAATFNNLDLSSDPELARKLDMLRVGITLPAPATPGAADELAEISTRLQSDYSTGKIELNGEIVPLDELEVMMGEVRDPDLLEEIWTKWREVPRAVPEAPDQGPGMHADYQRMVEIANAGARDLGFADVGE
ncbi:MAG: M2 family metallopeptidase, partial [Maricaulaceae bacterium]